MVVGFILCTLTFLGGVSLLVAVARRRMRAIGAVRRIPRDLGALILIERFGQRHPKGQSRRLARPERRRGRPIQHSLTRIPSPPEVIPTAARSSSSAVQDPNAALEAAAQGAWFGMSAFQNLLEIDEHVYTAMGTLAGTQLDSIGDLSQYLASWGSAELGEALPQGALNKLMGHLAEPVVAQHLEDLGIQVEMPDTSNQEGYDLVLNGEHAVNVKTVADADSLVSHFAKHPQIPVIVPEDMAGIPGDAIYLDAAGSLEQLNTAVESGDENIVLVDNALSHAELLEHTESVGDALLGNVDPIGIPFITLALSGFREIRLIATRKTELRYAARNLGLDLAGTGGGGMAGAAAGAAMGTAVLPGVGTAIGGVVGGIVGAIGGRGITNSIKRDRLQKAIMAYEVAVSRTERKILALQKDARRQYESSVQVQKVGLAESAETRKSELEQECAKLIQQRRALYRISPEQGQELLDTALAELNAQRRLVKRVLAAPAWIPKILLRTSTKALQIQLKQLDVLSERLESEASEMFGPPPRQDLVGDRAAQFLQLLLSIDGATSDIRGVVHAFEMRRKELEAQWRQCVLKTRQTLADHRYHCMAGLARTIRLLHEEMERKMRAIRQELELLAESVMAEQGRLGRRR